MKFGASLRALSAIRPPLERLGERMADLIWPRNCPVPDCGKASDRSRSHLCSACFAALPFMEQGKACAVCGMPIAVALRHAFVCEECSTKPPDYEIARSALEYAAPADDLIKAFKYQKALHLAEDFGDLLAAAARAHLDAAAVDVIVPVPLSAYRRRERGFNQSEILGEALARRLNRRLDAKSLIRRRDTPHQTRVTGEERLANLHAAFCVERPEYIRGRTVLVVDDVMTTGATLNACARALRQAGAARVWCLTLARAIKA